MPGGIGAFQLGLSAGAIVFAWFTRVSEAGRAIFSGRQLQARAVSFIMRCNCDARLFSHEIRHISVPPG